MPSLTELPSELLIYITDLCSASDVKYLCETCHLMWNMLQPELYRTVDLSSHNNEAYCQNWNSDAFDQFVLPTFSERHWDVDDEVAYAKQALFMRTILENTAYGKHVLNLHWTVLDTSGHWWGKRQKLKPDDQEDEENEALPRYEPEDEPMWQTFESLVNVNHVDLCWVRSWREVTLPRALFSSATSIRLSGCMSRDFIARLLYPQLGKTSAPEHLDLNDLSQFSEPNPLMPKFDHLRDVQLYYNSNHYTYMLVWDDEALPRRQAIDVLDPLAGRCASLTSPRIAMLAPKEEQPPGSPEDRQYASCARVLDSVRQTLRSFTFEQSFCYNEHARDHGYWGGHDEASQAPLFPPPMDQLFAHHVWSNLIQEPWPCMKTLQLFGVGETQRDGHETIITNYPSDVEMQAQLSRLLPHADIQVSQNQAQDFESFREDGYGIADTSDWRS